MPCRGTGWSPRDVIWLGNAPVATGWKQSVAPLLCKSVTLWLVGSEDAMLSLGTSLIVPPNVWDVVAVEDELYEYGDVIVVREGPSG